MELMDKLRGTSWWTIIKSLPFYGGASSTKWVYIASAAIVNACLTAMTSVICYMYVRYHIVNLAFASLIASTVTAVVTISANSANKRRALNAERKDKDDEKSC